MTVNACSSLYKVRVRVLPDKRVYVYDSDDAGLTNPRKAGELPDDEVYTPLCTDDGWLVFRGFGCLPYSKNPSTLRIFTLEEAWDFGLVEVERRQPDGRWKVITSWEEPNA